MGKLELSDLKKGDRLWTIAPTNESSLYINPFRDGYGNDKDYTEPSQVYLVDICEVKNATNNYYFAWSYQNFELYPRLGYDDDRNATITVYTQDYFDMFFARTEDEIRAKYDKYQKAYKAHLQSLLDDMEDV